MRQQKAITLRVFPRRTNATPDDPLAYVGEPNFPQQLGNVIEVNISVTFTWDSILALAGISLSPPLRRRGIFYIVCIWF